jgi:WD40 repeat protein
MTLTSTGQCIQLIDYKLYLNLLHNPTCSYQLQPNPIDGYRSSYFFDSTSPFMSTTLLNDENHVIIRFLKFSSSPADHSLLMLSNNPSASKYYYQEKCQTIQLSSSLINYTSPLMIKCSGPCCYSKSLDHFAFNINNYLYIYDLQTFQCISSLRVPIRRVTLNDIKFSNENSNIIYTTNGNQFQQWDIRQSNNLCSLRIPILCSTIKCLQTKSNYLLTSSFDEKINLIDLRQPTKPLLIYDSSTLSSNNPHFTFTIDYQTEHFIAACSQYHIINIWELNSSRLLNRLRCPIPQRFVHTSTKCSIGSIDKIPLVGIYHPEYNRITKMIK